MSKHAKRNSISMIVLALCTFTIIWTNYIFSQNIVRDIHETLMENEYEKIWWKENYLILQEIQKREIVGYIDKIKEEQPELIEEILKQEKVESNYKILKQEIIDDLKKDTSIIWNTWSLITIIEFSDMECEYCIKQHSKLIKDEILTNFSEKVNYLFKNFPLPTHKNSSIEAEAAKCVEKISGWEKYLEFIDNVFNNTTGWWEWYNIEDLPKLADELSVDKDKFETCMSESETKEVVEREFTQWRMLGIESVPANLIINNETWEYLIITEEIDYEDIEKIILDISE